MPCIHAVFGQVVGDQTDGVNCFMIKQVFDYAALYEGPTDSNDRKMIKQKLLLLKSASPDFEL